MPTRIAWSVLLKNRLALRLNRGRRIIRTFLILASVFFNYLEKLTWLTLSKSRACTNRKAPPEALTGLCNRSLTMTYSHMGKPHTTIGAKSFHFWVRNGIRWFQLAMVVKQYCMSSKVLGCVVHQPWLTQIGRRNVKPCCVYSLDACVSYKSGCR